MHRPLRPRKGTTADRRGALAVLRERFGVGSAG